MAERQAELDLLAIEKDLAARRAEERRLSQQLELFGIELQTVEADLARIERETNGLRAALAEGEARVAELHAGIVGREREVTDLRERREDAASHLNDQRVALASRAARRDETLRDLVRMRQELQAAEDQVAHLTREAEELGVRRAGREAERGELRERLTVLHRDEEERQATVLARAGGPGRRPRGHRDPRGGVADQAARGDRAGRRGGRAGDPAERAEGDHHAAGAGPGGESRPRHRGAPRAVRRRRRLDVETARAELEELRTKLAELGPANLGALEEYQALCQRYEFLTTQAEDLTRSVASLRQAIGEINKTIQTLFVSTLEAVNQQFDHFWRRLIGGGSAQLKLVEPVKADGEDAAPIDEEPGVEMLVRFPGKRPTVLSLLSGGERALAALSLLLALFAVRPSPFCVLDEVDAPLDDANVERFVALLREMSQQSQFIAVTHNKRTMESADILYGITMEEEGVSKVMSVRMKAAA